ILALHAWRLVIIRRGVSRTATDEQWDELCQSIARVSILHGVWIGVVSAVLIPYAGLTKGIGIALIVLGIQAGSIATLSVFPPAFWGFGVPIFIGFSIGWFRLSHEVALIASPLYLLLMFVLLSAVKNSYQVIRQSWDLRSERNRALANAEEANRQKSRFLAAASHDLRQPAAALGFMAEELNERALPSELRPIAVNIQRSSENIRVLLDKLFDLSKLDTPLISNSPKWVSLEVLAQTLATTMESRAKAKGLELNIEHIAGFLWADPAHIQRLLSNLLDNAVKYTDAGSINMTMTLDEQCLRIVVRDTGRGIARDQLDQVWAERIQGSDLSGEQAEFSLGLGLSIVSRLAQILEAQTSIESTLGQGTAVGIRFDANLYSANQAAPELSGAAQGKMAIANGKRLLLVEDNPDVRDALSRHLQRLGFIVDTESDAASARKKLSAAIDYAMMITDYRLPANEVGTSLINFANADGRELPCLLISADEFGMQTTTDARSFAFLRKPIQTNSLRNAIETLLTKNNNITNE
ncbi:MAG: hybrid sensor histidine kinase/response regulator, partial [Burkholderiaceae bacterium]